MKVASTDPVRYRTGSMRATLQPCALTHRVYPGNFLKKINFFVDFFFVSACTGQRRPCALSHRVYEGNFGKKIYIYFLFLFLFYFSACTGQSKPCALTHKVYEGNFATLCVNAHGRRWQLLFHGWGHEEPGYIRMLYYGHEAGNSVKRFEVWSKWIRAEKTSKEEGPGGGG